MVSLEVDRDVDVDNVPALELPLVGDAVADDLRVSADVRCGWGLVCSGFHGDGSEYLGAWQQANCTMPPAPTRRR